MLPVSAQKYATESIKILFFLSIIPFCCGVQFFLSTTPVCCGVLGAKNYRQISISLQNASITTFLDSISLPLLIATTFGPPYTIFSYDLL